MRHDDGDVEVTQGRDGCEVFQGVKWQAFEKPRADSRAVGHQQQGVAIGISLGNRIACHNPACTRLVFNHHGLAHVLGYFFGDHTRCQVSYAARAKGHNDFDGPV